MEVVLIKVFVYHGDVEQALRNLKKRTQMEQRLKRARRCYYEKPSEKRARKKAEALRRRHKVESKRQRFEA